jgi:hypothetical protein
MACVTALSAPGRTLTIEDYLIEMAEPERAALLHKLISLDMAYPTVIDGW